MRYAWILVILAICGCSNDLLEDHFEVPWVNSIAIMKGSSTVTKTASIVEFELDIVVLQGKTFESVKGNYTAEEAVADIINPYEEMVPTAISFNSFEFEDYSFSYRNLDLISNPVSNEAPFSIGLLIDISDAAGSYSGFGFKNQRLESLVGMIQLADANDEFLIGTYQRISGSSDLELIESTFTTYSSELAIEMGQLADKTGGRTPLYDAANKMLDLISANAKHNEKHLIIYATKEDDASINGFGPFDIIQKAQNMGIKVSVIWAPDAEDLDWQLISQVTSQTGGFGAYAGGGLEGDVTTLFLSALNILRNRFPYYTVTFEINDPSNAINDPFNYINYLSVVVEDTNTDGKGSTLYLNDPVIYYVE